jgi:predicted patatin/cPLA2 family phospholipase
MPLLFPIYHMDGQPYLDGGVADSIPWKRALEQGCDRVLVVLSHTRRYIRKSELPMHLICKVYEEYPKFVEAVESRAQRYNKNRAELFELERQGKIRVIAPTSTLGVSRLERDTDKLRLLWAAGYQAVMERLDELRAYFHD